MRPTITAAVALALTATLSAPHPVAAAPAAPRAARSQSWKVVQLAASGADGAEAARLTEAFERQALTRPALAFVAGTKRLLEGLQKARCGGALSKKVLAGEALDERDDVAVDTACLEKLATYVGAPLPAAQHFVWGHVYRDASGARWARLHAYEAGEAERSFAVRYEPEHVERAAERLLARLFLATSAGEARFEAPSDVRGELWVNGERKGAYEASYAEYVVGAGQVTAEVRSGGRVVARGRGKVEVGQTRTVVLEAVDEPVREAVAPPVPPPVPPPTPPPVPSTSVTAPPSSGPSGGWMTPTGLVAVGTGALALGFGVFANSRVASLNDDSGFSAYRRDIARGQDVCDAAERGLTSSRQGASTPGEVRDNCSSADTWKALRVVSYVGGGLLVAGGATLLLLAPSSQAPGSAKAAPRTSRWQASPSVGPSFAGVSLRASW